MHCLGGNATHPTWRVLASSKGISSWIPLKPQHSNPNPNPNLLANQLWCIDFLTPPTPLIIPHKLPGFLMPLKTDAQFLQDGPKAVWSIPYVSVEFFQVQNRILLHIIFLKCPHVQIAFLKFTSCYNQALLGCIPIAAVTVYLNLKS